MKLHESQRSALAEAICRRWIRRRKLKLKTPPVYVVRHSRGGSNVWGWAWPHKIVLHLGPQATNRREQYILLAHEFTHYLVRWTTPYKHRVHTSHGERFQRVLWGVLPYGLWKRAGSGHWATGSSAHKVKFQPDRPAVVDPPDPVVRYSAGGGEMVAFA